MNSTLHRTERGSTALLVAVILLGVTSLAFAGLSVWAYINYSEQKSNVDAKVSAAVAKAEKEQADADEAKFADREKEPNREFIGPADYGSLSFDYPKTWSVYVSSDGSTGGGYEAFFNPIQVPSVKRDERFSLRVSILNQKYESVIASYESGVENGDLRTSVVKTNGQNGTRLDGNFSNDIRGAAVIFKIRDKTAVLQTDADTFKKDFDKLIKTIKFVQ